MKIAIFGREFKDDFNESIYKIFETLNRNQAEIYIHAMKSEAECAQLLQQVRKKGFSDAFIVKFVNGQRIK